MTNAEIYAYMTAGKAVLTVKSLVSGNHFTYRINPMKGNDMSFFVSLLTGPNNEAWGDFSYLGIMEMTPVSDLVFRTTAKSCAGNDAASVRGFKWLLNMLNLGKDFSASAEVGHEGRCGRCGRTLTEPKSIESGIGPICREKMGVAA